jgi:hypothetical protein
MSKKDPYKQAYERERQARLLAEQLLDEKTRSLYKNCIKLEATVKELQTTQSIDSIGKDGFYRPTRSRGCS